MSDGRWERAGRSRNAASCTHLSSPNNAFGIRVSVSGFGGCSFQGSSLLNRLWLNSLRFQNHSRGAAPNFETPNPGPKPQAI